MGLATTSDILDLPRVSVPSVSSTVSLGMMKQLMVDRSVCFNLKE